MIISHAIRPFRFGGIAINQSLWMDGKPWFTAAAIREFIGLKSKNAVQRIVSHNPHIKEFSKEIEILQEKNSGDQMGSMSPYGQEKNVQKYTLDIFDPIGLQLVIFESRTPKARAYKVAVAHLVWAFLNGRLVERTPEQTKIELMLADYLKIKGNGEKEYMIDKVIVEAHISRSTFYRWLAIYRINRSPYDKQWKGAIRRWPDGVELEIRRLFFRNHTMGPQAIWKRIGSPKNPGYCTVKRFYRQLLDEYYAGYFPALRPGDPALGSGTPGDGEPEAERRS